TLTLLARAYESNGLVQKVQFFSGDTSLGLAVNTNQTGLTNGNSEPLFSLVWPNVSAGAYALKAVATDAAGMTATSTVVNITVTNSPPPPVVRPYVYIYSPANGAKFAAPATLTLLARAYESNGLVQTVQFFAGEARLGVATNTNPAGTTNGSSEPVFSLVWPNVVAGAYALKAVATDTAGMTATSTVVNITVTEPLPVTNRPPEVRITSPPNAAQFRSPVNIPIYAYARDPDGLVTSVEFFAGGNSLGLGAAAAIGANLDPTRYATNYFLLVWSNAPVGSSVLTARATDNSNAVAVSLPVTVTVLPPSPPVTNTVPTVSIVAIDPVAIEGTNCWVYAGASNSAANWTTWPDGTRLPVTNCGPKNATFAVQRSGDTNRALTVAYGLGGTASNGVDYLTLPGVVTIPVGQRQAMISIVPLDDGPPDVNTTVIIRLGPANSYRLGSPASAEALIIDNVAPSPATTMLADKTFRLNASGPTGAWFRVDYSTNMFNWMPLCTNQVVNGSIDFVDPNATGNPARFYRVVPEANPPQ
ncbi:MAG: Ig-like domain-containing protein, partial [Verrucomicrobia bacterium]|nr:Ig-like domain-containing protein [Verrucomicrobiota bacterium]